MALVVLIFLRTYFSTDYLCQLCSFDTKAEIRSLLFCTSLIHHWLKTGVFCYHTWCTPTIFFKFLACDGFGPPHNLSPSGYEGGSSVHHGLLLEDE